MRTSDNRQKRHHLRDSPQYLQKEDMEEISAVQPTECALVCDPLRVCTHTHMGGCTGGNERTPQPECVYGMSWWEGARAREVVFPPPPPGPWVAPLH